MRRRAEQRGWTGARAKNRRAAKAALFCARDGGKPRVAQPPQQDRPKCEDRRAGEITTERMPANQEAAKRILFGGEVVGVIDPAARPIRSMTASAQISYPSLRFARIGKARSFHCASFPKQTRFAGLCFGIACGRVSPIFEGQAHLVSLLHTPICGTFCVFCPIEATILDLQQKRNKVS